MSDLSQDLITIPEWAWDYADPSQDYPSDEARMRLAISLARRNVAAGGGPFGAAVFERRSGRLIAAGVNLVLPLRNSILQAEIVALMLAEKDRGSHRLSPVDEAGVELVTSSEPCAMCLGAVHWSGVSRLVCEATKADVERINFEEGPVGPEFYRYLEERGLEVRREVCRRESKEALPLYARENGVIY